MKKLTQIMTWALFFAGAMLIYAQTVTGTVRDASGPLPGANILEKGTTNGTTSDFDGKFSLNVSANTGTVIISFVGYVNKSIKFSVTAGQTQDLGEIVLESDNTLEEVVLVGVADIAKDRQTPVAVSTIKAAEIIEILGTKEFPEILNATPSVYATKQGGGFGDSRINIRGFDQSNTAVMINGMPVNDMENGWVYWSNWAGLSDVTSAMQVQRGLGSSKLAISSVGGTINVLTRAANMRQGGTAAFTYGNDNYIKTTVSYNTGKLDNGLSVSALLGRTAGDGYVDGTEGEGYNYYLAFGFQPSDSHDFQLTITGAPQYHYKRSYAEPLSVYQKYGKNGEPNIKYNSGWGWRNGEIETFAGNFYHKPIASLNWDWKLSDASKISTVLYGSLGRGGSIGSIGRINGNKSYSNKLDDANGQIRFDDIIAWNKGQTVTDFGGGQYNAPTSRTPFNGSYVNTGDNGIPSNLGGEGKYGSDNGISQRSSMNSHNWFGAISNFNTKLNENLTLDFGVDLRTYKGIHYRRLVDVLGADKYVEFGDVNNPNGVTITETYAPTIANTLNVFKNPADEQKIHYYNEGKVKWGGVFSQLEYTNGVVSAFIQGAFSSQSFQRIDYFNYLDSDPKQTSKWVNILGGNVKGGLNWNIDEKNNIFFNAGYYSKQPLFDAIFTDYNSNDINEDYQNETIIGLEAGYGFRSENYSLNINLYRTSWADRFESTSETFDVNNTPDDPRDDVRGYANINNVKEIHMGVEIESRAKFGNLDIQFMTSIGDWKYSGTSSGKAYDEDQNYLGDIKLYLDDVRVGDAAQFTARLGLRYEIIEGLKFDISQMYFDHLYADINATDFGEANHKGSLELPSYALTDTGISYLWKFKNDKNSLSFRFNVNNLANTVYISESDTNYHVRPSDQTWKGVSTGNRVYFGWGRTWNFGVRFRF